MATKDNYLFSSKKDDKFYGDSTSSNEYSNLNLNNFRTYSVSNETHSKNFTNNSERQQQNDSLEKNELVQRNFSFSNKNFNNSPSGYLNLDKENNKFSTTSYSPDCSKIYKPLFIPAYENTNGKKKEEKIKCNLNKEFKQKMSISSSLNERNSVEIPRLQDNVIQAPAIMQFRAVQVMLNPNGFADIGLPNFGHRPFEDVATFLADLGLPNIFNLFHNVNQNRLEALESLQQLLQHGIITLQFILFLDELMRTRAMRIFRPRREFYNEMFYYAFGFTPTEAENLLLRIGQHFHRPTRRNWAFYTPEILMMSLRHLRVGNNFWDAGYFLGGSRQSANACFWQFIDAVLFELADLVTLEGTPQQWMHLATENFEKYGISNVVGAIDGSYIQIRNIGDENNWFCRKGYPAINLTMFVDPTKRIRFFSCKWPGSMHDVNVYRNTGLAEMVRQGWEPFPGAVILGDSAYIGADRFIVPYPREYQIQPHERAFYEAHKEARSIVERVYGELKGKFGILSKRTGPMNFMTRRSCSDVIKTCCYLHNFLMHERDLIDDGDEHFYFRDLDPNLTPAEDLIEMFNEDN